MEPHQSIPRDDLTELPLFPLNNVVLFPGMRLPLHIFEERYKAMIGECVERDAPFGVILIKEGQEVGEPAEPFRVGTTARIVQVNRLQEGRLNIMTRGERRFQVVEITQQVPHLVGLVRYLEDEAGDVPEELVSEVTSEYRTFLTHQATIAGGWNSRLEVTHDPVQLFSQAISSIASSIELPRDLRQQLLELSTTQERLEKLLPLLKRGNELMLEQVAKSNPFQGPRLN
jgi:Lon protease-like protein